MAQGGSGKRRLTVDACTPFVASAVLAEAGQGATLHTILYNNVLWRLPTGFAPPAEMLEPRVEDSMRGGVLFRERHVPVADPWEHLDELMHEHPGHA